MSVSVLLYMVKNLFQIYDFFFFLETCDMCDKRWEKSKYFKDLYLSLEKLLVCVSFYSQDLWVTLEKLLTCDLLWRNLRPSCNLWVSLEKRIMCFVKGRFALKKSYAIEKCWNMRNIYLKLEYQDESIRMKVSGSVGHKLTQLSKITKSYELCYL